MYGEADAEQKTPAEGWFNMQQALVALNEADDSEDALNSYTSLCQEGIEARRAFEDAGVFKFGATITSQRTSPDVGNLFICHLGTIHAQG